MKRKCFIDATFVMAKGGGVGIGPTKRGKGMKIMAIVDRHGLPLSVSTHAANHHEVRLVQLCFDFYMIEAKPENLIGDRAYDSDPLDEELRKDGIEMIAPHRSNRSKPPTQDRRRLSRYMRRWLVERLLGFNGSAASSSVGNTTPRTSSASYSSLASLSSSGDFEIGSSHPDKGGDARPFVFRARGGQRPNPFVTIDFLGAYAADLTTTGARQKLKFQDIRGLKRKGAGVEPFPERLDFLHGQHAVTRRAGVIALQSGGSVRLHDVLRQGPSEHGADGLPTLLGFPLSAPVSNRVQQFPNVAPADFIGVPVQDWRKRPIQTALDFLCGPQPAGNPASHVQFDQFFDGEPRSRCSPAFLLLRDQVAARPCRACQLVGALACLFEAYIGYAPGGHPPHLPRATNPIGQIPRFDAARRHPHR